MLLLWMKRYLEKDMSNRECEPVNPEAFAMYWLDYVEEPDNLPMNWFSWHSDVFNEDYEHTIFSM